MDSCFGVGLKTGYEEKIREFKRCYLALGITVTLKVFVQQGANKNEGSQSYGKVHTSMIN